MNNIIGIDVSHHDGIIDWKKVSESEEVNFAIIRMGYGDNLENQDDKQFANNIKGVIENNIPFGVYFYSYAKRLEGKESVEGEIAHAKRLLKTIPEGNKPFAVYYSLSSDAVLKSDKSTLTSFAEKFCSAIKDDGYYPGVYMSENGFNTKIDVKALYKKGYSLWVAKFSDEEPNIGVKYDIWNYKDDGTLDGINDGDGVCFDYMLNKIF